MNEYCKTNQKLIKFNLYDYTRIVIFFYVLRTKVYIKINCKICKSEVKYLFSKEILSKYNIKYYQCSTCLFIQTEKPYWQEEA
jgi:hypothetical protein